MSDKWWNLDQAIAWVMTGDSGVVATLAAGGITAFISYPMDHPYNFHSDATRPVQKFWGKYARKTHEDLLCSLRNGKIQAKGKKNGSGDTLEIDPDTWEDLTIKFPPLYESRNVSSAVAKNGNGSFWSDIRLSVQDLKRFFPETPTPAAKAPDQKKLDQIVQDLITNFQKEGKTLNRDSLYSEVNARLIEGQVTSEWARNTIKTFPSDLRKPKHRPRKIKSAV